MARTKPPKFIDLTSRHAQSAFALSAEAMWNQNEADWEMMIDAGHAVGFEAPDGKLVATALTLPYGPNFGWISMVLVTQSWRKKGLATRLLKACIDKLEADHRVPVLDATPAGEHVYRPLGFAPGIRFLRWQHPAVEAIALAEPEGKALDAAERGRIRQLDADYFGGPRPVIIENLFTRCAEYSCMDSHHRGFLLGREGRLATQIGPVCAANTTSALAMLDHALARLTGPVFIDANEAQLAFVDRLKDYGFEPQRPFLRMAKGVLKESADPAGTFAIAGPELG